MRTLLPRRVVAFLAALRAGFIFRRALGQLKALPPGELPSDSLLDSLVRGWNNDNFVAQPEYLREVGQSCALAHLPVLECGSGLTTIVCAAFAARRGLDVWTLENDPRWFKKVFNVSRKVGGRHMHVIYAPLRNYGEFDWYGIRPEELPARFGLAVCDGPKGTTRGGRFGLMAVLGERLGPGSIILADDAHREAERSMIERWKQFGPLDICMKPSGSRAYAVITRR